jgi:hypothetical protein
MSSYKNWAGSNDITSTKDIERGAKYQEEIANLMKHYGGTLEQEPKLSPLTPILVRMENRPPGDTRCLPEINHMKQELPLILKKYGVKIEEFDSSDISNDPTCRRITILLRKA